MTDPEEHLAEDSFRPLEAAREGAYDEQLRFDSPLMRPSAPVRMVIKRDGREEPYDKNKIAAAILRAADSAGEGDRDRAMSLASGVTIFLSKRFEGRAPTVAQVQDAVEKVLLEMGHARTALAFARHRRKRTRVTRLRQGDLHHLLDEFDEAQWEQRLRDETHQGALFVRTSSETLSGWDRSRIVDALVRETRLDRARAESIALEVEAQILSAGISPLTTALVRELVDAKLAERGLEEFRRRHMRIGVPLYDAERIICTPGETERMCRQDPETTDRFLAQRVKREYALTQVFSERIVDAHVFGDLHLCGLGYVDRFQGFSAPIDFLVRYGGGLPGVSRQAAPPQDLEGLLVQLGRFRTQVDAHFAGPVTWDMPHVYLSPFLDNATAQERQRAAQILLFVLGTDAAQRAAKPELTLSWDVPARLARRKAEGPAHAVDGRVYADFESLAQELMEDILATYLQANTTNRPLLRFVLDRSTFARRGCRSVLVRLAETALASGLLEIEFDRPCDDAASPHPRDGSPVAHVVNLNLARMAFRSADETALMENLDALVDLAAQAHQEKCAFFERLVALRALGPFVFLAETPAHPPLFDISRAVYTIAVDGLSECVEALCGAGPQQSGDAQALALRVLTRLAEGCRIASDRTGLRIVPAQARYESSVRRFAALDLRPFPEEARRVAKSDPITQDIHYTAGARVARAATCTPSERALLEGELQALVSEGALSRIELPDMETSPEAVASFIEMTWRRTKIRHLLLERRGAPTGYLVYE